MSQVYAGGPTSGGHYNPAVTVGAFVRFRMDNDKASLSAVRAAGYIVIQSAAALIAGAVASSCVAGAPIMMMSNRAIGAPYPSAEVQNKAGGWAIAVFVEALGTFALVLVVLNVATSKDVEKNSYFGIAIGFTVQAMAYGVGSISGGAFNPAVGLLQLINRQHEMVMVSMLWIFWIGPFVGGILAALFFQLQSASLSKVQGPFLETEEGLVSP